MERRPACPAPGPLIAIRVGVLVERPPVATPGRHHLPVWLRIVGLCILAVIAVGVVLLAAKWPFTQDAMTRALQEATSRPVRIGKFHQSYFPPDVWQRTSKSSITAIPTPLRS